MSLIVLFKKWRAFQRRKHAKRTVLKDAPSAQLEIQRSDWQVSLEDPTAFHLRCFYFFHSQLPKNLKQHRNYFSKFRRGFGEEAFHVMWFLLFREFDPKNFLEIGVYRGQTLSLAALLQQQNGKEQIVTGISPFESVGDSVSSYRKDVDYLQDTLKHFRHFNLPEPNLVKAFSTAAKAKEVICAKSWDCIYIDGNHDYEIVREDWETCSRALHLGGIIVLDDSGLTTSYQPPAFSFKGHHGPSQLAAEIDRSKFREILQVGHNRVFQKMKND